MEFEFRFGESKMVWIRVGLGQAVWLDPRPGWTLEIFAIVAQNNFLKFLPGHFWKF